MIVYRIIKTGFDSLENRNPVYYETLGVYKNKSKAEQFVKVDKKKNPKYQGYDGLFYPKYEITKVRID